MKYNKILLISALGLAAVACTKFDEILPEGGTAIASQVQEINSAIPERSSASFNGMLTDLGYPDKMYSSVPDDWEFLMILFCNDLEGADALIPRLQVITGSPFAVNTLPVTPTTVTLLSVTGLLTT